MLLKRAGPDKYLFLTQLSTNLNSSIQMGFNSSWRVVPQMQYLSKSAILAVSEKES